MEIRKVNLKDRLLEYQLIRKPVKNINLRIKLDGKIYVSANNKVSVKYIEDFIKRKEIFIIQTLEKYKEICKDNEVEHRQYVSGESYKILGKIFTLEIIEKNTESVHINGTTIILSVKNKENFKKKEKLINDWLKNLQIKTFNEISTNIYQFIKKYNIGYPQIKIRRMKTMWGSCRPLKGIITLNSELIKESKESIEYVVLHEFVHLLYPNHSKDFYNFLTMLMPDWADRRKKLNKI